MRRTRRAPVTPARRDRRAPVLRRRVLPPRYLPSDHHAGGGLWRPPTRRQLLPKGYHHPVLRPLGSDPDLLSLSDNPLHPLLLWLLRPPSSVRAATTALRLRRRMGAGPRAGSRPR